MLTQTSRWYQLLLTAVLVVTSLSGGTRAVPYVEALQERFPGQAARVIAASGAFLAGEAGFVGKGTLQTGLPGQGDGAVRFALGDVEVRVRELGARGEGARAGRAVAYEREGGVSFWSAGEGGYEEWLLLGPAAVHRDAAVAMWEIEGATLRQRDEVVELCDARGQVRVQVTAPEAYAAGGRPVGTWLRARGARIELWVDADGEAVLVDPGWSAVPDMSVERRSHEAVLLDDGRVLVMGGHDIKGNFLRTAEAFDPTKNLWTPVTPMNVARMDHAAAPLNDGTGRVLVAGGVNVAGDTTLKSAEVYDPVKDLWTYTPGMHQGRAGHTATPLNDGTGRVLVASESAEVYEPTKNVWLSTGPMNQGRERHTATLLDDGRVLVAGGSNNIDNELSSAEVYDPHTNTWTPVSPMHDARYFHTATLLHDGTGRVLVAGGSGSGAVAGAVEVYDPAKDVWTVASPLHDPRTVHTATLLDDGRVLVAGGLSDGNYVGSEVYDPASDLWTLMGPMKVARAFHRATRLSDGSGRVLVTGGEGGPTGAPLSSAEMYDSAESLWGPAGSMAGARYHHTATPLGDGDDRVLVAGGTDGHVKLDTAEVYDPTTGLWLPASQMGTARVAHTATLLDDGSRHVLVAGGETDSVEMYDPAKDVWTPMASLGTDRESHTATLLKDGSHRVLVAGGYVKAVPTSSAEMFDPAMNVWRPVSPMKSNRVVHTATLLRDGRVLVTGGLAGADTVSSAELYDAAKDVWTDAAPMSAERAKHTATLLNDGRVLVTGGLSGSGMSLSPSSSAEVYDPEGDRWTPVSAMSAARAGHTATPFGNGLVLVAGGTGSSQTLNGAELYDPVKDQWRSMGAMQTRRTDHTATLLGDGTGRVLVAGGSNDATLAIAGAEILRLLDNGNPCDGPGQCASGFCADGVCCDAACDAGLCSACSVARGSVKNGACTQIHPECSPFACVPGSGACRTSCGSIDDCDTGFTCVPGGRCVTPPPDVRSKTYGDCAAAPATLDGSLERALMVLAALAARRRRGARSR